MAVSLLREKGSQCRGKRRKKRGKKGGLRKLYGTKPIIVLGEKRGVFSGQENSG